MSASSIGIQTIMPETGTKPQQQQSPAPQQAETERGAEYETMIADAVARQAPPPPGMGKLVDKTI